MITMTEYKCDVCKAEFSTNDPQNAMCPACGEHITERDVKYTDRKGSFTIGGKVSQL